MWKLLQPGIDQYGPHVQFLIASNFGDLNEELDNYTDLPAGKLSKTVCDVLAAQHITILGVRTLGMSIDDYEMSRLASFPMAKISVLLRQSSASDCVLVY